MEHKNDEALKAVETKREFMETSRNIEKSVATCVAS